MRWMGMLLAAGWAAHGWTQESAPLESSYTPFDFDHYRQNPTQVSEATRIASKPGPDFQRQLRTGEAGRTEDFSRQAAGMVRDPAEIPLEPEPEDFPTRNQLVDEVTRARSGDTTKGPRDMLARVRVEEDLQISTMSEEDYGVFVSQHRAQQREQAIADFSTEELLQPMPTLINSKTGGPPHAYSVSQAGWGARAEPRNAQNPFEDLLRALRLDRPVTKGSDPLPSPSAQAPAAPAPLPATTTDSTPADPAQENVSP